MENFKLYRVSDQYIRFLQGADHRVQNNKGAKRPYVGVVLLVGQFQYFVPMESPKPNHAKIRSGVHIMRIDNGRYGLLGFNNMIPIPDTALIPFDINAEPDPKYADLLRRQITFLNRNKADVMDHAARTYYQVTSGKNKFLVGISCDFKKLERSCTRYDPNFVKKPHHAPIGSMSE